MNIVLLSGGSGKRLWPLSNEVRSKQFIKILKKEDGTYESMLQRFYDLVKTVDAEATVTIATSRNQVSAIRNQLEESVAVSVEPCRRDTFPAIALAAAYLKDVQMVDDNEPIVICPVDPLVDQSYFEALKTLSDLVEKDQSNLVLMGMEPTEPSERYGYIIPEDKNTVSRVSSFKEKPCREDAEKYLEMGALWNGGVFACRLKYVLNRAHELIDFIDYEDLYDQYANLKKISFDYAVVENESDISVLRFNGKWEDLGTWRTLTQTMEEPAIGAVSLDGTCDNVRVINELDTPILCMGLKDVVVAASRQGILVSTPERTDSLKSYVEKLDQETMFAEKSWGDFSIVDVTPESRTIHVVVKAGHRMSYHSHEKRNEIWTVIAGEGKTIVDGKEQRVTSGDVITLEAGCRHTVIADTQLTLIEVQLGENIDPHDKKKYDI